MGKRSVKKRVKGSSKLESVAKTRAAKKRMRAVTELSVKGVLFVTAVFATVAVFFIFVFLIRDGYHLFETYRLWDFLAGSEWKPYLDEPLYGAWPLIVGTLLVTLGAMLFSVPLSIASAVYIAEVAPPRVKNVVKPAIELLSGIPSVVYGFFGLLILSNWLRVTFEKDSGTCWLAASIILGIMALPTITSVAEDAISSVPREYREGSLAVGATRWQTIKNVTVPSAMSGITAGIILGIGRAVGETMAVMMVAGNAAIIPDPAWNVWSPIRTITATLGIEMFEVPFGSEWYHALFALAVLLLIITLIINMSATFILGKLKEKHMATGPAKKKKDRGRLARAYDNLPPERKDQLRKGFYLLLFLAIIVFLGVSNGPVFAVVIGLMGGTAYYLRRVMTPRQAEKVAFTILTIAVLVVIFILGAILYFIIWNGAPALSWEFLTQPPEDLGRAGGIGPAIAGTLYLVAGAIIFALPIGIGAAIYLTEYTKEGKLTKTIRAGVDLLNSTPSIIFGMFGAAFFVIWLNWGFSLLAGQLSLGFMILPTIIRTTEEALRSVPQSVREGSYAVGATKWQTIRKVVLPPATPGIITGTILSIGRAAGETAPIMLTAVAFSRRFMPDSLFEPVMALPFHLFALATNVPGATENQYGTALVLLILVVSIYLIAIVVRYRYIKKMKW
jgi:phosphate transport system permease protein